MIGVFGLYLNTYKSEQNIAKITSIKLYTQ